MKYKELAELYDKIASTSKRLEKAIILSDFMKKHCREGKDFEWTYLLLGRVYPEYNTKETGMSKQLVIKAIADSFSAEEKEVNDKFSKIGDLGEVAAGFAGKGKQGQLSSKSLETETVIGNIRKLSELEGKGTVGRKIDLVKSLYMSADKDEAKYITRTLLGDLRIGIASALILDAIALAFFENDKESRRLLEEKYLLANDVAAIAKANRKSELDKIGLSPGTPTQAMLSVKVESVEEAFETCGRPAAFEYKYDGFRVLIHKNKGKIILFTRKLENVSNQFPDAIKAISENVKGESFILDTEVVGYDRKTGKYKPFEAISQRIRRKYEIEDLVEKLPVEINVFDVLYYNNESTIDLPFKERRKIVEKIINEKKFVIRPAVQIIADNEKDAEKFYGEALGEGEEGVMIKSLDKPYRFGRYVGYMAKLKPIMNDIDLVITGAEHGTGKRGGWLSSYIVACRNKEGFVDVGKVSSGLKEKKEEGFSYDEMTKLLEKLKISEENGVIRVKPKVVVSVNYQNIQPSPEYSSGFALRFPRITHYRPDRGTNDISTLDEIEKEFKKGQR